MADYFDYVEQYRIASSAIPESGDVFWPRLQTRGLLIELTLKTYLSKPGRVTVPGKPSDDLAPGTLNSILKQAGLKNE